MTAAEFKIAFETRFYAATTVNSLGWSNDEISEFLNYAQYSIVRTAIDSGNLEAISNLVRFDSYSAGVPSETYKERRYELNIPNCFEIIDAELMISTSLYPMEKIDVKTISEFKVTPYNAALFRKPKFAIDNSVDSENFTVVVLQGGYVSGTPTALNYRYVLKPTAIDIDNSITTNLNEKLTDGIVELAVQKAVESYIKTGQSTQ